MGPREREDVRAGDRARFPSQINAIKWALARHTSGQIDAQTLLAELHEPMHELRAAVLRASFQGWDDRA